MIVFLHWSLALASAAVMALAGVEAGARAVLNRPSGKLAARISAGVLILVGVTAAGGLGMFLGGARPHEGLHFLYAPLAFAALPVASTLTGSLPARGRALATLTAALLSLVLIARLFMTG
jgi:hypothetical protein